MIEGHSVLVSGAGVAGLVCAWWLHRAGYHPVVVERSPSLRASGHAVDLWGSAVDVMAGMGLEAKLRSCATQTRYGTMLASGGRRADFPLDALSASIHRQHIELMRSDLVLRLAEVVGDRAEFVFGDEVHSLHETASGCEVQLRKGRSLNVMAVVGADGVHSRIREIVFGAHARFERHLGASLANWTVHNAKGQHDTVVRYLAPDRTIAASPIPETSQLAVIALWRDALVMPSDFDWRSTLRTRFAQDEGPVPYWLTGLDEDAEAFTDAITRVDMENWHQGHVALIGDAGFSPGAAVGGGTGLAVVSAYRLVDRMRLGVKHGLPAYSADMRPLKVASSAIGPSLLDVLIPRSRLAVSASLRIPPALARLPRWLRSRIPLLPAPARRGLRSMANMPLPDDFHFSNRS